MPPRDSSLELGLPELLYGSVWVIGPGDGDRRHLSRLAVHALATADAVIHDPGISNAILDVVKPPRYLEMAKPHRAIQRLIKLARDGWRVVHLVEDNALGRAIECAINFAEQDIPFRIVPSACEPIGDEAPLGLLLVRRLVSFERSDPRSSLVLLVASPQTEAALLLERRLQPLGFSMSGLAG